MAFDVGAIRSGLKTRLETIEGLRSFDLIPDRDVPVPAAVVQPVRISYEETFGRGIVQAWFRITILVSAGNDRTGQNRLDAYLSAGTGQTLSIVDAIEADKSLGGSVDSSGIDPDFEIDYGRTVVNEVTYWKADVQVKILRSRS